MRNCPSCDSDFGSVKVSEYNKTSLINVGLEPPKLSLCACGVCGMMYVDGDFEVTQSWFDHYYIHFYKTDDKPFSDARLESLARCVHETCTGNQNKALDIGGMDFELTRRLEKFGFIAVASGVDGDSFEPVDAVVLSHTLEHIYDVPAMFQRIKAALVPGGLLFIEVPIWLSYDDLTMDNHWQHVNKFRPKDLENILKSNGFDVVLSERIADYREYNVWRIIGRMV